MHEAVGLGGDPSRTSEHAQYLEEPMQDYQVAAIITAVLMPTRARAAFVAAEPGERMDLMGKSWLAAYEIVELAKSLHEDEVEQADRESPP